VGTSRTIFALESRGDVVQFFAALAARTSVVRTRLGPAQVQPPRELGASVAWIGVEETNVLRGLHEQINSGLKAVVADPAAPFDGPGYTFHMTLGFLPGPVARDWVEPESSLYAGEAVSFSDLALFVYDGLPEPGWQSMTYRVLPLGRAAAHG